MIRIIYYALLFYIFYKIINYFLRMFNNSSNKNSEEPNPVQQKETPKKRFTIEQKDIVDASFEEIKEEKKEQAQ